MHYAGFSNWKIGQSVQLCKFDVLIEKLLRNEFTYQFNPLNMATLSILDEIVCAIAVLYSVHTLLEK